jgi:hypothetical protein
VDQKKKQKEEKKKKHKNLLAYQGCQGHLDGIFRAHEIPDRIPQLLGGDNFHNSQACYGWSRTMTSR